MVPRKRFELNFFVHIKYFRLFSVRKKEELLFRLFSLRASGNKKTLIDGPTPRAGPDLVDSSFVIERYQLLNRYDQCI